MSIKIQKRTYEQYVRMYICVRVVMNKEYCPYSLRGCREMRLREYYAGQSHCKKRKPEKKLCTGHYLRKARQQTHLACTADLPRVCAVRRSGVRFSACPTVLPTTARPTSRYAVFIYISQVYIESCVYYNWLHFTFILFINLFIFIA